MLTWAIKKVFGTSHERSIRRMRPRVESINALEDKMKALSDAELRAKTAEFRQNLDNGATLEDLLVDAFAVCREASRRVLRMRHYDVQLIGGMVLHNGCIAEMRTGEGKTLVATLPCYLNALESKGVHVVTVNDYLATRDAEWMGKIYKFLGMSVGTVVNQQTDAVKKEAYRSDITYGQNNEFGFDYLRDNMKFSALEYAQRPLNYAIVDEVDSILIDEARTPLIISGQGERSSEKYRSINEVIPRLKLDEHYVVDEKGHSVTLTDSGVEAAQKLLGISNLYDPIYLETLHIMNQCLRAHTLYKRDVNYMVSPDGKVLIIDEFTGRVLPGRRWSDGLHQAVEAKENVPVQEESRTMATITFQNLFRLYKKLAGMTGTADTEAAEFHSTYKLDVTIIPTNKPIVRADSEDVVYKTEREKFTAVIKELVDYHERGQPVLVGTTSVEKSGAIARILQKKNIPHNVLNAKHHAKEAQVIAQAGRKGAITVSTNMAGRGTDIILGGNAEMMAKIEFLENNRLPDAEPEAFLKLVEENEAKCAIERQEVVDAGGLHILGTERHESRRIDNQLRGRAGRQGDPGSSRFYLSLEDDLMRIFAGDKVKNLMDRMGMPDDEPIEHPWVTKSVQNAQQKVEERNFDIRKNLLEYDDVMSAQRKTVYTMRQQLLEGRYSPEEVDEDGKPTGDVKGFESRPGITEEVVPRVTEVLGMFAETPVRAKAADGSNGKNGHSPIIPREAFENVKLVELSHLQQEVYQWWGVRIEVEGRETDGAGLYDELVETIPLALTEQRERMLDLVNRIIGAMVEESCPMNKTPDDWDWNGIREGYTEHFGISPGDDLETFGDPELLARALYDRAFEVVDQKQKELGIELCCRVFRHLYLEEIDRAWVEHLTNMDHLRDGIGLRGYGQKDPKQEYKKEGYDLFVNMMAAVCSIVVTKLLRVKVQRQEEIAAIEAEDAEKHAAQLQQATARHGEEEEGAAAGDQAPGQRGRPRPQASMPPPASRAAPKNRAQRSVPLRKRQEVQEVPRNDRRGTGRERRRDRLGGRAPMRAQGEPRGGPKLNRQGAKAANGFWVRAWSAALMTGVGLAMLSACGGREATSQSTPGGGGGSGGTVAVADATVGDVKDEWSACSGNDCSLLRIKCHMCVATSIVEFTAVNSRFEEAYISQNSGIIESCGPCTGPPPPDVVLADSNFVALCESGRCRAIDLRSSRFSECKASADCELQYGAYCCGGCGNNDLIAVNPSAGLHHALCGDIEPPCVPPDPQCLAERTGSPMAVCSPTTGHCEVAGL